MIRAFDINWKRRIRVMLINERNTDANIVRKRAQGFIMFEQRIFTNIKRQVYPNIEGISPPPFLRNDQFSLKVIKAVGASFGGRVDVIWTTVEHC